MGELLQNPRRSPRAPARCRVSVISGQGAFDATTEDVGAHGCQLVSPRLVRKGEPVQLTLVHEGMREPLRLQARVAWASERAPWRLGIAYDEAAHADSTRWFERLLSTVPGLSPFRRIPDRIPVDAVVYLASPPRFLVDFTPDEVALLRSIGSGAAVAELRAQLHDRWPPSLRALFSLLAHNHVTLSRGSSVHPDAWRKILAEAEATLAVEALRGAEGPAVTAVPRLTPPPAAAGPALRAMPAPPALAAPMPAPRAAPAPLAPTWPVAPVETPDPTPAEPEAAGEPEAWLASAAEMMLPSTWAPPAPPRSAERGIDAGAPWSGPSDPPAVAPPAPARLAPATGRSPEAQGCYERALAELSAGRMVGGTVLLRRALALAPGDPEIAGALASASGAHRTR